MTTGERLFTGTSKKDYDEAGSKFITMAPGQKDAFLSVEIGAQEWDTPGKSIAVPVTVIEPGIDEGKQTKLSYGVDKKGIWKGKEIYQVFGLEMPEVDGQIAPDPMDLAGRQAIGHWQMTKGRKGGAPDGEIVFTPKLVRLYPAGYKPQGSGVKEQDVD